MTDAIFELPVASNEPVLGYAPGSPERKALKAALKELKKVSLEVPMVIGGEDVFTK